ncbi:unnamed protein product [Rotaria magnacalcarata]|uniref:Uncharacterized protein n=1 Tax=Rotaria magnacalcarata TaxID=392030 RepID=A0A816YQL9_9BILA|nr:unnamed protein product [Rotaria magnacalcarata]
MNKSNMSDPLFAQYLREFLVKSKQCTPAEPDGFVLVESDAADVLSQKQHEDIESDYERGKENNSTSVISLNVSEKKLSLR